MSEATDERTKRYVPQPGHGETARYQLEVASGPDAGQTLLVHGGLPSRVYLGTSSSSHLRLTDPHVSRRHLALDIVDGRLRLSDLGSTNGTYVNGACMLEGSLVGGELIGVGDSTIRVEAIAPAGRVSLTPATSFGRVLGASAEMKRLYPLCERVAASDIPVLIEGETGSGKEVLAESVHEASARSAKPFVVFDCTTVAATLMESALFGHERGAFTGAVETQLGIFEQAQGGTLLIDEIGDLDIGLQAKLMRAIDRGEVCRVGSTRWIKCDVRIIAATRRDLEQEIAEGRFRDDLFYRLVVARIELPPLRKRRGDIALLARQFWKDLGGPGVAPPEELRRFESYAWPGNVRELYNAVAARIALGEFARIEALASVPSPETPPGEPSFFDRILALDLPLALARQEVVEAFERLYIEHALERSGGSVVKAAAAAGVARRYFQILKARQSGKTPERG